MPRTREFNPEVVLDAALDLFWSKGYKACSMADVVKKSGVARYGLYQAFTDKDQLYYATLKRYHQRLHDLFVKPFCGQRGDFHTLVEHFNRVLEQLEKGERDGCFAHQAAIERGAKDEHVHKIVNCIFDDTKNTYRTLIRNGISDGHIRALPVEDLVTYVMGIQRALIAMTKQRCSVEERHDYVRCALQLLKPSV
ncbi:TetR/AcrR family transcriptional regulator [Arenicella sp. 4NH20-0111]|uniref:TetR/AcrR family transcriptional regulator n=1 Tax=Arenicella sp. 4NH20-0111 TaxID=3127648 RepID=UPI0033412EEB